MPDLPVETYISVDIETAGPNPTRYSLLSIGACTLYPPRQRFYAELQPVNKRMDPAAFAIHKLSLEELEDRGEPPAEALARFEAWLASVTPRGNRPIFLAFNAPFDWMFVCDYFHRFLDRNPFGYAALDIKAFYMGFTGSSWAGTSMDALTARYPEIKSLNHHALDDAEDQADIFIRLLSEAGM